VARDAATEEGCSWPSAALAKTVKLPVTVVKPVALKPVRQGEAKNRGTLSWGAARSKGGLGSLRGPLAVFNRRHRTQAAGGTRLVAAVSEWLSIG